MEKSNSVINVLLTNAPSWYAYWEIPIILVIYISYVLFIENFLDKPLDTPFFIKLIRFFKYLIPVYGIVQFFLIFLWGFKVNWLIYECIRIAFISLSIMVVYHFCLLYTSPSPRDRTRSRMPSSA